MASALRQRRVALDIESNGFHRYPERVCLVQLAVADKIYLIDPLSIEDMTPLEALLLAPDVQKIFHAAAYDIRSLHRDWGFRINPLFDTSIAAAFLGYKRLGLASILEECLDVEIPKSKKLQRADWTIRPLSAELLRYAAEDVLYLDELAELLSAKLKHLGRTEWAREECERLASVKHSPSDIESAFLSVKGSRSLDSRGLAILRSLYIHREHEALQRDRPPFKIFSDTVMLHLAANPHSDLSAVKGIGRYAYGKYASGIRNALREGLNALPFERPKTIPKKDNGIKGINRSLARKRLHRLKQWRIEHAKRLGIDPGIVWPASSLERLSSYPTRKETEMRSNDVRTWQRQELGESLLKLLDSLDTEST